MSPYKVESLEIVKSARHHHFIEARERLLACSDRPLHLKGLCDTRWNCRSESLTRLANPVVYMAVLETVDYVADTTSDCSVRGIAAGLRTSLTNFSFAVQLLSLQPVMALINEIASYYRAHNWTFYGLMGTL